MINIINLTVQFSDAPLFENVNLKINKGDRICLVGSNGAGKSTFLNILYGIEKPENGKIIRRNGIRIGYLPQEFIRKPGSTLFAEVRNSLDYFNSIEKRESEINLELLNHNLDDAKQTKLLNELGEIHHQKEIRGFYEIESNIEKVLVGLGFNKNDFKRNLDEFSGGWLMRIELAKLLLNDNDLLMLDEPTNHLDLNSLEWLIAFLHSYKGTLIIVSHDRYFVNELTDKTLEIFQHKISFFKGNYESYLKFKVERTEQIANLQKNMQKKIKETEDFIERFRYKASKAKQVQSRIKRLKKLDSIENFVDEKNISIRFPKPPLSSNIPIELKNISFSYEENIVFDNLNFKIEKGDKFAFLGPNGSGKTTFSKILARKLNINNGSVIIGKNTTISYYSQEIAENLDIEKDVLSTLSDFTDSLSEGELRKLLGSFLFSDDDVFKKVKVLSGGEKSRLALAKILLTKANLIILDEPTNHLDFNSKAVLQQALAQFNGELVIVSHDIDFIRPIANKIAEFDIRKMQIYHGNIDYYLEKRELFNKDKTEKLDAEEKTKKINRKSIKRSEAELRNKRHSATKEIKNRITEIEDEIENTEIKKSILEKELLEKSVYSNPQTAKEKTNKYNQTKHKLEELISLWAELNDELEKIEKTLSL